jgi:acetyltransferase
MAVIFGTPGLNKVFDVYHVLDEKMKIAKKPVFPILPSILTAAPEIDDFISRGRIFFRDEVVFGNALSRVYQAVPPENEEPILPEVAHQKIRKVISNAGTGYLSPAAIGELLDACGIPRAREATVTTAEEAAVQAKLLGYPLVMKVVGPVHKSDVGGVVMNVKDELSVRREFGRMIEIPDTTAILLQQMLSGTEVFIGAKLEPKFGHMVLCGLGGIFIEVMKDISAGLAPLGREEALRMIRSLKGYAVIKGIRGREGVNEEKFAEIMLRLCALLAAAPEILELDFNPLLGNEDSLTVVDARINVGKR